MRKKKKSRFSIIKTLLSLSLTANFLAIIAIILAGILLTTTVSSYYYLNHKDKDDLATNSNAKIKDLGSCTCNCGCKYGDFSKCVAGGSSGQGLSPGLSSSNLKFSGSLDKSNIVNQIFFLNNDITHKLGVPIWLPYATTSVETGGSIYRASNTKIRQTSTALDSVTTGGYNGRKSDGKSGAAGWFQIEGISVEGESGFIAKDVQTYQNMLQASGIDVNNYPGMSSTLQKEISLGHTQWYWDCEYYPAAIVNFCLSVKERKDIALSSSWLSGNPVFQSYNQQQKDLAGYYIVMTLHNNGSNSIKAFYEKDEAFFNYLRAFIDVMTYKSEEFANQNFGDTWGNASFPASTWVINNNNALTPEEKSDLLNKYKTLRVSSKDKYRMPMLARFCNYGTNGIYNAVTKNGGASALSGLEKAGIVIEDGWFSMGATGTSTATSQSNNSSTGNTQYNNSSTGNTQNSNSSTGNTQDNNSSTGNTQDSSSSGSTTSDDFSLSQSIKNISSSITTIVSSHLQSGSCTCSAGCICGCPCSKSSSISPDASAGAGSGLTLSETKGIPQGIYSDLNGNSLSGEEVMNMFKSTAPTMAEYYKDVIGIAPTVSTPDYWAGVPDRFSQKFGDNVGVIHYTQHRVEPYGSMKYVYGSRDSDGFTANTVFAQAACGFCAISIASSTMLHRYISPPEVIMASYLSPKLSDSPNNNYRVFAGNVLDYKHADTILDTFRFRGKKLFETTIGGGLVQSKLDETLDAGGMCIFVTGNSLWTGNGHFIVIRDRDSNGKYYTVDSSVWILSPREGKPNRPTEFSEFSGSIRGGQVFYIKPGEGYNDYLEFHKGGQTQVPPDNGSGENVTEQNGNSSADSGGGIHILDSGVSPDGKPILQRDIDALHKAGPLTDITEKAISRIGGNYLWGTYNGNGNNFDCSGLVCWAYRQAGHNISGTSGTLAKMGREVSLQDIKPGDLVFYSRNGRINHVTMYIGGGYVVSASGKGSSATPSSMGMYSEGKHGVRTHVVDYRPITCIRRIVE